MPTVAIARPLAALALAACVGAAASSALAQGAPAQADAEGSGGLDALELHNALDPDAGGASGGWTRPVLDGPTSPRAARYMTEGEIGEFALELVETLPDGTQSRRSVTTTCHVDRSYSAPTEVGPATWFSRLRCDAPEAQRLQHLVVAARDGSVWFVPDADEPDIHALRSALDERPAVLPAQVTASANPAGNNGWQASSELLEDVFCGDVVGLDPDGDAEFVVCDHSDRGLQMLVWLGADPSDGARIELTLIDTGYDPRSDDDFDE